MSSVVEVSIVVRMSVCALGYGGGSGIGIDMS
jgi:hypothetical protein